MTYFQRNIKKGDKVQVFDSRKFRSDVKTPLDITMCLATVVERYDDIGTNVVDVIFDHSPGVISKGHFTYGVYPPDTKWVYMIKDGRINYVL